MPPLPSASTRHTPRVVRINSVSGVTAKADEARLKQGNATKSPSASATKANNNLSAQKRFMIVYCHVLPGVGRIGSPHDGTMRCSGTRMGPSVLAIHRAPACSDKRSDFASLVPLELPLTPVMVFAIWIEH